MENEKNVQSTVSVDLQLFAEGAAASGTGSGEQTGETGTAAVSQNGENFNGNELASVAQPSDGNQTAVSQEDRKAAFEKLIKEDYADLYKAKMAQTVKERLKASKVVEEKYNRLTPMLQTLARVHGVDAEDVDAIVKAVESDDALYDKVAMERGITTSEAKRVIQNEVETASLRREIARMNQQKAYELLQTQAQELKTVYPSFDLENELKTNSTFKDLLRNPNFDMRKAYEATHLEEVMQAAMQYTAQTVEKRVADTIAANGVRPIENGNSSQGASLTRSDVSKLSKEQRQDMIRRAARGERIEL